MSRNTDHTPQSPASSSKILFEETEQDVPLRRAPRALRDGRAAIFAALVCAVGGIAFLIGQLGWWTLIAGPAYLAGAGVAVMLARGRAQALLAVVLATASTAIVVGLIKLTGLI